MLATTKCSMFIQREALTSSVLYAVQVFSAAITISRPCPCSVPGSRKAMRVHIPRTGDGARSLRSPVSSSGVSWRSHFLDDLPQQPLLIEISPHKSWLKGRLLCEASWYSTPGPFCPQRFAGQPELLLHSCDHSMSRAHMSLQNDGNICISLCASG